MSQSLKEQIRIHIRDAMGDFPTPHLLEWHTGVFLELIKAQRQTDIAKIAFHFGLPVKDIEKVLESKV